MTVLRVIFVTGDRAWSRTESVADVLRRHEPGAWVIQGGAPGADHKAEIVALASGHQPITMTALWQFHGKKAGPIRNRQMGKLLAILKTAGAEIHAYAFHDNLAASKGTKDMTTVLDRHNISWELVTSTSLPDSG